MLSSLFILLLFSIGQVHAWNPYVTMLVSKFNGSVALPEECLPEDQAILETEYISKVAATEINDNEDLISGAPGTFSNHYSADKCVDPQQITDLNALLASTAKKLSPKCQTAVLSKETKECITIVSNEAVPFKEIAPPKFGPLEAVKEEGAGRSLSGFCPGWCVGYCFIVPDCYCYLIDPWCSCCDCDSC